MFDTSNRLTDCTATAACVDLSGTNYLWTKIPTATHRPMTPNLSREPEKSRRHEDGEEDGEGTEPLPHLRLADPRCRRTVPPSGAPLDARVAGGGGGRAQGPPCHPYRVRPHLGGAVAARRIWRGRSVRGGLLMTRRGSGARERSRGISGGKASAASPTRYAPLRAITQQGYVETLECGHTMRERSDMFGTAYASSRRCVRCLIDTCSAVGHVLDIVRGTEPSCRCGAADGAASHLGRHRRLMYVTEVQQQYLGLKFSTLKAEHLAFHGSARRPEVEHWHWNGDPWGERTRPDPEDY